MATFNVEIDIDNAAFEDSAEVSRILRTLADKVEVQVIAPDSSSWARDTDEGGYSLSFNNDGNWPLMDVNGNRVGSAWIEED